MPRRCGSRARRRRACYDELAAVREAGAASGPRNRLALRHLLGAAGSSPAAAAAAAARIAERAPADDAPGRRWRSAMPPFRRGGKEAALIDLLAQNPAEKKLVFVHHRETPDASGRPAARRRLRVRACSTAA